MTTLSVNSVYLSGWEYNRLLQPDPTTPRNSALPAEILWNGAAYLWLFEHVYCSTESLQNEYKANEILGWTTGRIFQELENREIVVSIDWAKDVTGTTRRLLSDTHKTLRERYDDGHIRRLIREQSVLELEKIKIELIQPIAENKRFVVGVTPNSLSSAAWTLAHDEHTVGLAARPEVQKFLADVAQPILGAGAGRRAAKRLAAGLLLCQRPGTGVNPREVQRQSMVQRDVEGPMIPSLLAGDGNFTGATGYEPYLDALKDYRDVYEPINTQLMSDWRQNSWKLDRLRQEASRHLWPQLHGEWLPRLLAEPSFAEELPKLLQKSMRRSVFGELLSLPSYFVFGVTVPTAGLLTKVLAELAQLPGRPADFVSLVGSGVAAAAVASAKAMHDRKSVSCDPLALFYQKAKKVVRQDTERYDAK